MSSIWEAALRILTPEVLGIVAVAAAYGTFMGAVPGLTATMAVALLVPITFFLDPISALAAIVTLEACAIFAGDIPAALVRIPGTPSSAALTEDAYALARRGKAAEVLGVCLVFSCMGGLFGGLCLIFAAPVLARAAFFFTTYEFFWLTLLGLSCGAILSKGSPLKGLVGLLFGLLVSTVGLSEIYGIPRFTFGRDELAAGVNFIPAMIGLFGFSEVLRNLLDPVERQISDDGETAGEKRARRWIVFPRGLKLLVERKLAFLRSAVVGTTVGMLPGAGADIAAWISMGLSKKFSRQPESYGRGSVEGVADAAGAHNAALGGAWIPALVFGIPGDSVTAIVIGVLLMKNITPGPRIFADESQSLLVHGIYLSFIVANLLLVPIGYLAIRSGSFLVRVPRQLMLPSILVFCILGSYAINGTYFDVWVMLAMGIIGFLFEKWDIPLGPVVLAIILGGQLEQSFLQNLAKSDSLLDFFSRPIAACLALACALLWLSPLLQSSKRGAAVSKPPNRGKASSKGERNR